MDYENKICYYMCVTRASTVNLLAPFFIMGFSLLSEMEFFAVPKNGISLNI